LLEGREVRACNQSSLSGEREKIGIFMCPGVERAHSKDRKGGSRDLKKPSQVRHGEGPTQEGRNPSTI